MYAGIDLRLAALFSPWMNGQVEQANDMEAVQRHYVLSNMSDWDDMMQDIN